MIAGLLHTAFWIGMVLLVAVIAGLFWLIVNFFLDEALSKDSAFIPDWDQQRDERARRAATAESPRRIL